MGFGLGKNSPIVLSLGKANYEAMIDRHGQWVRWRMARKCPCLTESGQPNIHCGKCGGTGYIYDYQKYYRDTLRLTVRNNILELPEGNADCEVLEIYNAKGREFPFVKSGGFVEITGEPTPKQNEMLELLIRESVVKHLEMAVLEKIGNGFYRVPDVESPASNLEGVYYKAPGDVVGIARVETENGELVTVKSLRQNMVRLDSDAETLIAYGVSYILPFKFALLSQNLDKSDEQLVNLDQGEAICTLPYAFEVSENDCITVLSGMVTAKAVIPKSGAAEDIIPEFFVTKVSRLETAEKEYREGTDFILTGTNQIFWLSEDRPAEGAYMSLVYQYCPTYRVTKNIPMLRTSEDQRLPRKVIVKLYSASSEASRVNQNG